MARSVKTMAHALRLARSDRRIVVAGKPEFYIDCKVGNGGAKTFTLACGAEVSQCGIPEGADVRQVADQLCDILLAKSGATAAELSVTEPGSAPIKLELKPVNGGGKRSK